MPLVFTTCSATFGSGVRMVGTTATKARPRTAPHGYQAGPRVQLLCAVAPGIQGFFAAPSVPHMKAITRTGIWDSGSPEHFPLKFEPGSDPPRARPIAKRSGD